MSDNEEVTDPAFKVWLDDLNQAAIRRGYAIGATLWQTTGAECWHIYYTDGYSPEAALAEDESYD